MIRKSVLSALAFAVMSTGAFFGQVAPAGAGGYGGYYSSGNGYYHAQPTCYYEYYWVYDPYLYRYVQKKRRVCY